MAQTRYDVRDIRNIFHVTIFCVVHILRLIMVGSTRESVLVGDLYAIEYIAHLPTHYQTMVSAFRSWVRARLQLVAGDPPDEVVQVEEFISFFLDV